MIWHVLQGIDVHSYDGRRNILLSEKQSSNSKTFYGILTHLFFYKHFPPFTLFYIPPYLFPPLNNL